MLFAAFGITGDLMRLKILPALHALYRQGVLPPDLHIVGISRRAWGDAQLREYIREIIPEAEPAFLSIFTFLQGDTDHPETFATLNRRAGANELLLYLSLAPMLYRKAIANMQRASFAERQSTTRVMLEKPFGRSGAEAENLYTQIQSVVAEQHIYLVDHYLAKEWVQELAALPVPHESIARIELRFLETLGVEMRGVVHDQLGTLRDAVQNHLLQMLAYITAPESRAAVLELLPILTPAQVAASTLRAQYRGYREISGVAPDSQTETYCKVALTGVPGWEEVAITLEAGKRLANGRKEAVLTLTDGTTVTLGERPNKVSEYETLLLAALQDDHALFPSLREVRAQWRFIDPILEQWALGNPALTTYSPGELPNLDKPA